MVDALPGLTRGLAAACRVIVVALILAAIAATGSARADATADTEPATGEIEALLATLKDDAARAALIAELETLIAARRALMEPAEEAGVLGSASASVGRIGRDLSALAAGIGGWRDIADWLGREAGDAERRAVWAIAIGKVVLVLVIAFAAGHLTRRGLARWSRAVFGRWGDGGMARLLVILGRVVVGVLPTVVFAVFAYGTLAVVGPLPETRVITLALVNATIVVQIVTATSSAMFAPLGNGARPLPLGDETAAYVHVWLRRLARVAAYGAFAGQALALLGVPPVGAGLVVRATGLVVVALIAVVIMQNRTVVANYLRGEDAGTTQAVRFALGRLADVWHLLAVVAVSGAFVAWSIEAEDMLGTLVQGAVGTVMVIVAAKIVLVVVGRAFDRVLAIGADIAERVPGIELRADRYIPVLRQLFVMMVTLTAAVMIAEAWGIAAAGWLTAAWARDLLGRVVVIGVIALGALLVIEITNGVIGRFLEAKDASGAAVVGNARLRTLLPLARNMVMIFVVAIALFMILSEIGVDIGPLLAGAGVIGLAVGFGAQTLVKDVITGAFILFENQMAIGDMVKLGGTAGVVEAMTVRTITLRDVAGGVHVIPFGEVTRVTNMTR
ncbi:MAG: mechanosensitive ion channel domain-containing protein [Alphaproteobacteria bacterium]